MSPPIQSSIVFDQRVREGLLAYKTAKKLVSFLTITLPWNSPLNIQECFRSLNKRLNRYSPFMKIEYIGVVIRQIDVEENKIRYHAHIFWRKPFIKFEKLKSMWENICKIQDIHFTVSTVTVTPKSVDRVTFYCINQKDEHFPCEIIYICSEGWGNIPIPKKREKIEEPHNVETAKKHLRAIQKRYGIGRYKDDS